MKNLKKSHKVLIGASLATLTLVPLIAVAATSCSNTATTKNPSTSKPSTSPSTPGIINVMVSTNAQDIQTLVNEISSVLNLKQLDSYIATSTILTTLNLSQEQVSFTHTPSYNNGLVTFSLKLNKNFEFNAALIKQSISGVTITSNTLTFNVKTKTDLSIGQTAYNLNVTKLEDEITKIENISTQDVYNGLTNDSLYSALDINKADATINLSDGTPLPVSGSSDHYASKTLSITVTNGQSFASGLVNQLKSWVNDKFTVVLSNNNQTLTLQNIPTKYVLTNNIPVQLSVGNLKKLSNYLKTWIALHKVDPVLTNPGPTVAEQLGISSGYLKISLQSNASETLADKDQAYDLTIGLNSGCVWANTAFVSQLNAIFNNGMSANFDKNVLTIKNIQTGIYTQSETVATVDSALFNADDFNSLQNSVNVLQQDNTLLTTINKVLKTSNQLPSSCVFVSVIANSSNSKQATICFANTTNKMFENISVNFTPKQLDPIVFGDNVFTSNNVADTFMNTKAVSCVLNNTQLTNDKILTAEFGLKGTQTLVTPQTALSSNAVQQIMSKFVTTTDINNQVTQDVVNSFAVRINSLFDQLNTNAKWTPTNFFITNSLVVNNSNNSLIATGAINLEIFNNTSSTIKIPANNAIFLNADEISLTPGQYVAVSYDFNNSKLIPMLVAKTDSTSELTYGFSQVHQTLVTYNSSAAKYESQQQTLTTLGLPTQTSNLLDVTLSGIANNPNYYNSVTQKAFNAYLGSLTSETIQSQLTTQNNAIWKFVQLMGGDLGTVLTSLGSNPTVGQFLTSLSKPVTDVATELTNDPAFGKLVGSLFGTETAMQFWTQNQTEITKIINQVLSIPAVKNVIDSIIKNLKGGVSGLGGFATASSTPATSSGSADKQPETPSISSIPVSSTTPTSVDIMTDLKDLVVAYTKSSHFAKLVSWVLGVAGHPTDSILGKQSILEIIGKDLQPILQDVITETKATQSNNPVWKLLNSILTMLTTIENAQTQDVSKSIYDLHLFDILQNPTETNAIISFLQDGLEPFLKLVNPGAVAPLTQAISIMTTVFKGIQTLKLTNPSLIFSALANLQIAGTDGKSQTITWKELFEKYITCTPTVKVTNYNPQTHVISYSNVLKYSFNTTVTVNLAEIKTALGDLTVDQVAKAFGVDLAKLIPSAVNLAVNTTTLLNTKVADLLPNQISIQQGDGAECIMSDTDAILNPTVVNGQITWWTNNPIILKFNFAKSADAIYNSIFKNVETAIDGSLRFPAQLAESAINKALASASESVMNFINSYADGTFQFIGGWVNKINSGLTNYQLKGYNSNVEDDTYQVQQNSGTVNQAELIKILTNPTYYKDLNTIDPSLTGRYLFNNDPALNQAIINQLINTKVTTWLTSDQTPANMKPTVLVQFIPNQSLNLKLDVYGIKFNKTFNVAGQFVVDLKFPTNVPVSTDGGKTYHMTNTISVTIPYNPTVNH